VASIWVAAVALGAGMSLLYPSLFTAVMAAAPEDERSHAVGTFSVFFDLSQGFGATFIGVVVSLTSGNKRAGFAAAGALAFVGLIAQWLVRDRIGHGHGPGDEAEGGDGQAAPADLPAAAASSCWDDPVGVMRDRPAGG
jgi:MFS family permease